VGQLRRRLVDDDLEVRLEAIEQAVDEEAVAFALVMLRPTVAALEWHDRERVEGLLGLFEGLREPMGAALAALFAAGDEVEALRENGD
jgi:hypothetical protein